MMHHLLHNEENRIDKRQLFYALIALVDFDKFHSRILLKYVGFLNLH